MKFATWNVNSLTIRLPQVLDWLAAHPVDALVLQETKMTDDKFPTMEIGAAGYQVQWFGQKTYNGVALISREPALDVVKNITGFADEQARVLAGTVAGVRVIGAYFPNGQALDSDKFVYKMAWLDGMRAWLANELKTHEKLVLMGDFNIAPEDRDVHDPAAWVGMTHVSPQERAHFQALLDLGLIDAYRLFEQAPKSFSWWDYRNLGFQKNQGLRIDHILVSNALTASVESCVIDRQMRKNQRPSDHAPVIVTLR